MELKAADPGDGAGRGADFRRIVGEGGDVVAVKRDGIGELAPGNLHAVARVAGEANNRPFDHFASGLG